MPELEISYEPEIWAPVAEEEAGRHEVPEVARVLAGLREYANDPGSGRRFLLRAEPVEPPIVVDVTAVVLAVRTSRAGAESAFPEAAAEQLEDVQLGNGVVACRYVRFLQVAELLPEEPGGEVFVAELHYVRAIQDVDPGCVLIATVVTPRISDLTGITEQVEELVRLATVS